MKKLTIFVLLSLLLAFVPQARAQEAPPAIPYSSYGWVYNGAVGMVITSNLGGQTSFAYAYGGGVAYTLVIPQPAGANYEGLPITYLCGGKVCGASVWHSGYSEWINLTVPLPPAPTHGRGHLAKPKR